MIKDTLQIAQPDSDPFGLRGFDFSARVPEKSEMFNATEAQAYIDGCDYPETADDLLLALEIQNLMGTDSIPNLRILDTMCGPGRLGREFLDLGANRVVFHDGNETMTTHAANQAIKTMRPGQMIGIVTSLVDNIPIPDNSFDLVVCHNSTHQLSSIDRLRVTIEEFLRLTAPGGHVVIADFQRGNTPEFLTALEERLRWTRPEIVPLLVPTFTAAFSKEEFENVLRSIPCAQNWSVTDAKAPILTPDLQKRVEKDPVKGHLMDYSPISLRVIIQKGRT